MNILEELRDEFPQGWFKDGSEFDGSVRRVVWTGEGSEIDGIPAFDNYAESGYTFGVLNELNDFVEDRGYYFEAYDGGTFFLYKH